MRGSSGIARGLAVVTLALIVVSTAVAGTRAVASRRDHTAVGARVLGEQVIAKDTAAPPISTTTVPPPTTTVPPPTTTTTVAPVVVLPPAVVFATGDTQLDALLATLPPVLFEGGAQVHFGYNPADCCAAGGYDPGPNEVWVSERALGHAGRLTYVAVHELAHSVHLKSGRGPALTAAVVGAPVVRAGQWDDTEKVADCVAWALNPAETAAAGITYWSCPEPWRARVRAALE